MLEQLKRLIGRRAGSFPGSAAYWEQRYAAGRNSGAGSYNRLALFKARIVNDFVAAHDVRTVLELGCGDGAQLSLGRYPDYVGIDVSPTVLAACRSRFANDASKRFFLAEEVSGLATAELTLSLDVIYHLVEDNVFDLYMSDLFNLSSRFVCIYSSNFESNWPQPHVRHRKFDRWIAANRSDWILMQKVANDHPYDPNAQEETSFADFHFYRMRDL